MDIFTVVDNIWHGEGFYFIIKNLDNKDKWKYGIHGEFYNETEAREYAEKLNRREGR
jgi:uncharacterized membrane protein